MPLFTVIGELVNMTRTKIRDKVRARDAKYIARVARRQAKAGATHIDVNAGGDPGTEADDMAWLTEVVAGATDLPLSFDSANPEALRRGLELANRPGTIINSITGERGRIDNVLPLVREYETSVVALTMDDTGMPEDLDGRTRITDALVEVLRKADVALDRAYFDHLVRPAGTNPGQTAYVLQAIRYVKTTYPEAHIALGMSNVSFGLPKRRNLNRAFLAMLVGAGCDGAILDPCEAGLMDTLRASLAVTGADEYGMGYLTAVREAVA